MALKDGWTSIIEPAVATIGSAGKDGTSAGVAIFARDFVGLRPFANTARAPSDGRVAMAIVTPPAHRPLLIASVYGFYQ